MENLLVRIAGLSFTVFAIFFFLGACSPIDDENGSSGDSDTCIDNSDCTDDGLFCSGTEFCDDGSCVGTGNPCANPTPICNEAMDSCDACVDNSDCTDDGLFCSGQELCDAGSGACFSAGDPCGGATPSCNEVMGICE